MKKYGQQIIVPLKIAVSILSLFLFFKFKIQLPPFVLFLFWASYLIYILFTKIRYKQGNANYIRIPAENDEDIKQMSIIFACMIVVFGLLAGLLPASGDVYIAVGLFIVGLLLLINGILSVPETRLKLKNNTLKLSGLKNKIDLLQIEFISLYPNRIEVNLLQDKKLICRSLIINQKTAVSIENYINSVEKKLYVVNMVNEQN